MSKGMLWCEEHDTDCGYMSYGICSAPRCNVEDPAYIQRQKAIEQRRNELYNKTLENKVEEKETAKNIRTQRITTAELLKAEIESKTRQMNRYYTRGWTIKAEKISGELKILERRLEVIS